MRPTIYKIKGNAVRLVEPYDEDAKQTSVWRNDAAVRAAQLGSYGKITEKEEVQRLQTLPARYRDIVLHIALTGTNRLIGSIALHNINLQEHSAEVGLYIGSEDCRGKGFGTAAMRTVCMFGFDELGLQTIHLDVKSTNLRAIRSYEKCGFRLDREIKYVGSGIGEYFDLSFMSVTRETLRLE